VLGTAGLTTVIFVAELTIKLAAGTELPLLEKRTARTGEVVKLVPVSVIEVPPVVGPEAGNMLVIVPVFDPVEVLVPELPPPV